MALVCICCWLPSASGQYAGTAEQLRTDSRTPYVHRLTLYDHDGTAISPDDEPAMPYSPRMTCGKCHPYAEISHGWHFNENDPEAAAGRPGEPWFLVDEKTGTVIPISGRGWPGTFKPQDAGLTDWQFVKLFGRHTPGGGYGEPTEAEIDDSPEGLRWGISGKLEIDCMLCHCADRRHDPAEVASQIERENFKWAATAAMGLAAVRGEARKAPDDWDPYMPPDPDRPEQSGPTLVYDKARFDPDDRVFFDITRRVPNEQCYFCHTVRQVGEGAPEAWHADQDVHLSAGLMCVDCHRHGIDHVMTRGYEGESTDPARASLTCRGCHLGQPGGDIVTALGGRLRAPHPQHRGLPPLHLEELTCTACHAGTWPGERTRRFQTARAHGLGLATRERGDDAAPAIRGPVFLDGEGASAPVPGTRVERASRPQSSNRNDRLAGGTPAPPSIDSQTQAGEAIRLARLVEAGGEGLPWYGYSWPTAHDVRPAAQALGVGGCVDCHSAEAPIFWGSASAAAEGRMWQLTGYDPTLAKTWALGFAGRPAFKWFAFICAGVVTLVLLRYATAAVAPRAHVSPTVQGDSAATAESSPMRCPAVKTIHGVGLLGLLTLAATGFGGEWLLDEVRGWVLLVHTAAAPLLIIGLTGVALVWPRYCTFGATPRRGNLTVAQRLLFWALLVLAYATMMTMLLALLPVFGHAGQEQLAEIHETGALLLLITLAALVAATLHARRAKNRQ